MEKINKKELLIAIFVSMLLLSNILSSKLILIGTWVIPGGIICYSITYLMTDTIGELYGRREANKTVLFGMICQAIASVLILITLLLPAYNADGESFNRILGFNIWFTVSSLIAYVISQITDVFIFHKIREKLKAMNINKKWIWNNTSTGVSQLLDSVIFVLFAFGLGMRLPIITLINMIFIQFVVKISIAILDTPMFYLITRKK